MEPRQSILTLFALLALLPSPASAQCPSSLGPFGERCVIDGAPVRLRDCPEGHLVFDVGALSIDVELASSGGFERVGEVGLSPLGSYPDWSAAPPPVREGYAAFARCAEQDQAVLLEALRNGPGPAARDEEVRGGLRSPPRLPEPAERPWPWAALAGVLLALAARARTLGVRAFALSSIAPGAAFAITLLARLLVLPFGYFHQNGQGPVWIEQTLSDSSDYGPGYPQLFGRIAANAADPDRAVFAAQATLAALGVAAMFVLARRVAGAPVAWAVALGLASSPILARLAHGESYFAAQGSLLAIATAVLLVTVSEPHPPSASTDPTERTTAWSRACGAIATGLLLSQVALVHPVAWVAAGTVPLALLAGSGPPAQRVVRVVGSALVCAGIGILLTLPAMRVILEGRLGAAWLAPAGHRGMAVGPWLGLAAVLTGAAALRRWRGCSRIGVPATGLAIVVLIATSTDLLGPSGRYIHHAYIALFLGPAVALGLRLLPRSSRWHVAPTSVLALGVLAHLLTAGPALRRPTDSREGDLMLAWREQLPEGALVVFLARGERRVLTLPLHRFATVPIEVGEPPGDLSAMGSDVFWYRSGLCSSSEGRATCDEIEATYDLHPMVRETLPAVPSIDDLPYDRDPVEVGLYRLERRR